VDGPNRPHLHAGAAGSRQGKLLHVTCSHLARQVSCL